MSKICTDLEQSKRLQSLGIDVNTADMYYEYILPKSNKIKHIPSIGNPIESLEWYNKGYTAFGKEPVTLHDYCIPAWSLTALMNLLDDKAGLAKEYGLWFCYDNGKSHCTKHYEDPVDAAFEMVVKI